MKNQHDIETLEMAMLGYQQKALEIQRQIENLKLRLRGKAGGVGRQESAAAPKKRGISAAGRARIAEAQRKRWAAKKTTTA